MDTGAKINDDEDFFLMANVRPKESGLPFTVYISEKGHARHDVRVKVAAGEKAPPFVASVSVRPDVEVVAGNLSPSRLEVLRRWIDLNRDAIVGHWDGDLSTSEALAALRPLPKI